MPEAFEPGHTVDVAARLRETAATYPDHVALRWQGGQRTYAELHQRVDAATAALQSLEVGPGDRIALVLGTNSTFVEAACAVLRAGAAMVPLLTGLAPDELRYAINDSGATVVVVGPERAAALLDLRDDLPDVRHLVVADVDDAASELPRWEELTATDAEPARVERDLDDLAALVYTSGTTGRPRGAMLSRGNLAANQDQTLAGRFQVTDEDVILLVLPLAHIYSLNVGLGASITAGATMVLVERFDPKVVIDAIEANQVTVVLGAPPMYVAWLQSGLLDTADMSTVRLAISGAAPLPVPIIHSFYELTGLTIEEGYGLTEASPSVAATSMSPVPIPGSVGQPLPGVELRLVDANGRDVAEGDDGEVWVRGPNVFQGYWNDAEATDAALTPDGWLRTGDVGMRDADGMLYLVDRLQDLVIVNGFNVYPREVERVLLSSGQVAQAAVVGAPHPLTGETLQAHVVPLPDTTIDVPALEAHCRANLARYKNPTSIEVVDSLPTTATGKIRRVELREDG